MNLCIPVNEDKGLQSPVCAHFGSAPAFLIVDTDTGSCRAIVNKNQHHGHGQCSPLASILGEPIDGVVVGGIGMGAFNKLRAANIPVHLSEHDTVAATIASFNAGTLKRMETRMTCAGHGADHH